METNLAAPAQADATQALPVAALLPCDIVMKGGITSGVVYPMAVCELAKTYSFKNIGGTSAGAIAAALTAAAEHGRSTSEAGFLALEELPKWLGGAGNLLGLFQPARNTRSLFKILLASLGSRKWGARAFSILGVALSQCFVATVIGAAIGLSIVLLLHGSWATHFQIWQYPTAALVIFAVSVIAVGINVLGIMLISVPRNFYGICNGFGVGRKASRIKPLTTWLADELDLVAGLKGHDDPLTFGKLWGPNIDAEGTQTDNYRVNLEMVTSCVTLGRPFRLPFRHPASREFFFSESEFRRLFPARIVDWMVHHPRPRSQRDSDIWEAPFYDNGSDLKPLPSPADLPVVVATRMSLSFPVLLSAIPLYTVDWTATKNDEARTSGATPTLDKCWFSDGGISSNFPLQFFDAPLPRWPTFGINLRPFHPDHPEQEDDECHNVWMPKHNVGGIASGWNRFGDNALGGFLSALLDTMQNWADNAQSHMPGYRDRIVTVHLNEVEGGLNLNMPTPTVQKMIKRGRCAGSMLVDHFATPQPGVETTWENHRWVRYRSMMSLIEDLALGFRNAYRYPVPPDPPYATLIANPPGSYPMTPGQTVFAVSATNDFVKLGDSWASSAEDFFTSAPHPSPELQARPRI